MADIWHKNGNMYAPARTAAQVKLLEPGVYAFGINNQGWLLEKTSSNFEFNYKIYGHNEKITDRIMKAWKNIDSNLGVILNGIKGTGKTISAQMICNQAIQDKIPVLVVSHPVPLAQILENVQQDIVIVFDEFEKTHKKPEDQQALLSTIDGMSRNTHRRLFIFTTNEKNIDANFVDRPSRVRYMWEFKRLSDSVIEELLTDLLKPECQKFRAEISAYINTRLIVSIDTVKTIINEANIFEEPPSAFEEALALSEMNVRSFTLEIIGKEKQVLGTLHHFFQTGRKDWMKRMQQLLTIAGREEFIEVDEIFMVNDSRYRNFLHIKKAGADPNEYLCEATVDVLDTWVKDYKKIINWLDNNYLWIDERPENWKVPEWAIKYEKGEELSDDEEAQMDNFQRNERIYGSKENKLLLIRFTPNFSLIDDKTYAKAF